MSEHNCRCPNCGSTNTYGISRVCGYFSRVSGWNKGKLKEFEHRQAGDYDING